MTTSEASFSERGKPILSGVQTHFTTVDVVSGKGPYLVTKTGQKILDFASGIAVTSTGHCHPDVVAAIQHQASQLIHACGGVVYYEPHIQLAETLHALFQPVDRQIFFTQSGSEAVETALKLARFVSKKPRFLAFHGGFHGRTLGAASVTSKYQDGYHPLLPQVDFLEYPYVYHRPKHESPEQFTVRLTHAVERYIETHHGALAGVIIEPVLGEGGYVPAPASFLKALASACHQYGVYLIVDEIQSGIGRTGRWFAYQDYGIEPDIITLAKGLGSGMPIGVMAAKRTIMEQWTPGAHGGTYGGNPVCAAAATATLAIVASCLPAIPVLAKQAMTYLTDQLTDHPYVGDIRVTGLMIGIECVMDRQKKQPNPDYVKTILAACLAKNLLVVSCNKTVIRLMPPLIIETDVLMDGLVTLCKVFHEHA